MTYQCATVGVSINAGQLLITDLASGDLIAEHTLRLEKGQIIKNTHHYRDMTQHIERLEAAFERQLGDKAGQRLCALLKTTSPKIYKDQVLGAQQIIQAHTLKYGPVCADWLERILTMPRLTATQLRDTLEAFQQQADRVVPGTMLPKSNTLKPSLSAL